MKKKRTVYNICQQLHEQVVEVGKEREEDGWIIWNGFMKDGRWRKEDSGER